MDCEDQRFDKKLAVLDPPVHSSTDIGWATGARRHSPHSPRPAQSAFCPFQGKTVALVSSAEHYEVRPQGWKQDDPGAGVSGWDCAPSRAVAGQDKVNGISLETNPIRSFGKIRARSQDVSCYLRVYSGSQCLRHQTRWDRDDDEGLHQPKLSSTRSLGLHRSNALRFLPLGPERRAEKGRLGRLRS